MSIFPFLSFILSLFHLSRVSVFITLKYAHTSKAQIFWYVRLFALLGKLLTMVDISVF